MLFIVLENSGEYFKVTVRISDWLEIIVLSRQHTINYCLNSFFQIYLTTILIIIVVQENTHCTFIIFCRGYV